MKLVNMKAIMIYLTAFLYNITQILFNANEDNEIYLLKMKKEIDKLNSSNYDYIICDIATAYVGYYIQSPWSNDNIMFILVVYQLNFNT